MANDERSVELQLRDLRRRFRWALVGYFILALGVVVALIVLADQQDQVEDQQHSLMNQQEALALAAGAYCVAGLAPDPAEDAVIHEIAVGHAIRFPHDCRLIIRRIEHADLGVAEGDP